MAGPGGEVWVVTTGPDADRAKIVHLRTGDRKVSTLAFPQVPSGYVVDELSFADSRTAGRTRDPAGKSTGLLTRDGGATWDLGGNSIFGSPRFGSPTDGWAPAAAASSRTRPTAGSAGNRPTPGHERAPDLGG